MRKQKQKILVAMSGGVDSSVAAALLVAQGYDVTGAFMVNYQASLAELRPASSSGAFTGRSEAETCWTGDYQDALRVAAKLGIPLMRLDFVKEYKKTVLDYMYDEYQAGRTPNPDVLCNKFVKFGAWLDKAKEMGFDKLATGHYARVVTNNKQLTTHNQQLTTNKLSVVSCELLVSKDKNKDQTYFLHQLNQDQLKHVLFPIGGYTKPEIRKLAKKFDLATAEKEESMGICFVGEVPMKEFLLKKIKPQPGNVVLSSNATVGNADLRSVQIGRHDGLPFYTIGQRQGLSFPRKRESRRLLDSRFRGNDNMKPLYVVAKNFATNELVVGYENDPLLYKKETEVTDINWVSGQAPKLPMKCEARLRHRQPLQKCILQMANGRWVIKFEKLQRAVTPGQFAVFYKKGECLGGGVIV